MPKVSVEIPAELLADLDEHVGEDGKFVILPDVTIVPRVLLRLVFSAVSDAERHPRSNGSRPAV